MVEFPKKLMAKLSERQVKNAFRRLPMPKDLIDFSSNDYLGFAKSEAIFHNASQLLDDMGIRINGATGSRLLTGNSELHTRLESEMANFFLSEEALVFNSGYDANIGFFSAVPQRNDIVLYDELCHASIRDGINMGRAKSFKFRHNDFDDLERKINRIREGKGDGDIYVVTESVFSMDGDSPDLLSLAELCTTEKCYLVVDEAHAIGIFGERGRGLSAELKIAPQIFARIVTFGKALGCHGAAILGSMALKDYLVNFARSLIYTTAMPPHALATAIAAFDHLSQSEVERRELRNNMDFFKKKINALELAAHFVPSKSAVHCCVVKGNDHVKHWALSLQENGFDVKPILSPTVPEGKERLRFCLHSFNTEQEIDQVLKSLSNLF